jgi:hypothetical protein
MQSILDFGVRLIVALQGLGTWPTTAHAIFLLFGSRRFFHASTAYALLVRG